MGNLFSTAERWKVWMYRIAWSSVGVLSGSYGSRFNKLCSINVATLQLKFRLIQVVPSLEMEL